jgi:hypothetical protein
MVCSLTHACRIARCRAESAALEHNFLSGTIPREIGALRKLNSLTLNRNNLGTCVSRVYLICILMAELDQTLWSSKTDTIRVFTYVVLLFCCEKVEPCLLRFVD